jgi:hypothetical protein
MRNWNKEILFTIIIAMESCWLAALFLTLSQLIINYRHLSIIGLWLAYPSAFILNRLLRSTRLRRPLLIIVNMLAMVIAILFLLKIQLYAGYNILDISWLGIINTHMHQLFQAFQPELFIIIGVGTFFWKGWNLAGQSVNFSTFSRSFQFGFSVLLFVLFICHIADISLANLILLIIVFSSLSLIGFGLYRSADSKANQATIMSSNSRLLLVVVVTIALLGLAVGSLITPELLYFILSILKWIGGKIAAVIIFVVNLFPNGSTSELPPGEALSPSPQEEVIEMWKWFHMSVETRNIMQKVFVSLFLLGIFVALYRVFVDIWHWIRRHDTRGVTIESLQEYSFIDFLKNLILFFKRSIDFLFGWLAALIRRNLPEQSNRQNSVRQIYRNLLHWGAAKGYPRRSSETPYEYLKHLGYVLPVSENNLLSQITEAYIVARYNPNQEEEGSLQQIKETWQILKKFKFKRVNRQDVDPKK